MAQRTTPHEAGQANPDGRQPGAQSLDGDEALVLPLGQFPGPEDGIGDDERAHRICAVLDQIDEEQARKRLAERGEAPAK